MAENLQDIKIIYVERQGLQGIQGIQGNDGLSAYDIAVDNGFSGTEEEWLDSLIGEQGVGIPSTIKFISSLSDFPTPVSNVITLQNNTLYYILGNVNIGSNRIVCGTGNSIVGSNAISSILQASTLSGNAMITATTEFSMRNITVDSDTILNLSGSGDYDARFRANSVVFKNATVEMGLIQNFQHVYLTECELNNIGPLRFDGIMSTISFSRCIINPALNKSAIKIESSISLGEFIRIKDCWNPANNTTTIIEVENGASIPVEGFILENNYFFGGGTYLSGINQADNKALFINNRNIENTRPLSYITMMNNTTPTVVSATNTEYKVLGTTTSESATQRFYNTNNNSQYTGSILRSFKVSVTASVESGNNNQIGICIGKNGTPIDSSKTYITTNGTGRAENIYTMSVVSLANGDYIEIFVENTTAIHNITVTNMSTIIEPLN